MSSYNPVNVEDLHDDTFNTVVRATDDVLVRLRSAQVKHGLTRGWRYPPSNATVGEERFFNTPEECVTALKSHLAKGEIIVRELLTAIKEKGNV
tara:strand:+ start:691 stop:972 length:282 start_codon:yes stop_codon:yes gene_type:complete